MSDERKTTTRRQLDILRVGEPVYIADSQNRITTMAAGMKIKIKTKTVYVFEDLAQAPIKLVRVILQ